MQKHRLTFNNGSGFVESEILSDLETLRDTTEGGGIITLRQVDFFITNDPERRTFATEEKAHAALKILQYNYFQVENVQYEVEPQPVDLNN